jgi:hypothetical protein
VLNLFETHPIELYHLTIVTADGRRERLGTTGNHPFYEASERRFVPARELRPGCRVVTVTGAIAEVEAVEVHTAAAGESFTTYNIEVEEDHTYHVGELGTWVHNESAERCLKLAREAADGSEEAVAELRRIFSKAPDLRRSIDGQLREIVDGDLLRRIDAPNRIPKVGESHPSLPVRRNPGDPTHGIFNEKKPLMSGANGGDALEVFRSRLGSLSDDAVKSLQHVEGHAAAEMVSNNLSDAVLHINYKIGPCQYCRNGVPELLGEGQKLWVVFPDGIGYFTNKGWFPQ